MRATRPLNDAPIVDPSPFDTDDSLIDRLLQAARRGSRYILSTAIALATVAFILSMTTWSVNDPSLNNATSHAPENLLGWPGAIVSDLAMQMFGLAGIVLVVPLLAWAHRTALGVRQSWSFARSVACFAGLSALAGVAAAWPEPRSWPLPVGLGGFVGEAFVAVPRFFLSDLIGAFAAAPFAILFAGLGVAGIGWGSGLVWTTAPEAIGTDEGAYDDEDDGGDPSSLASVGVGYVLHGFLSVRALAARALRFGRKRPKVLSIREIMPGFDDDEPNETALKRSEPDFDGGGAVSEYAPPGTASTDSESAESTSQAARVHAQRGALKQGKRVRSEAQPSFLPDDRFELPPLGLLAEPPKVRKTRLSEDALEQNARLLEGVLDDFGVRGEIINVHPGPVVTLYELEPAPGTKSSRVIGLADDIARSMSAIATRVAVVPGRNAIGIELPNEGRETVYLRELLASEDFEKNKAKLPLCLGKTIGGEPVIADLARMPHLLIAGTTGSGKSVAINTMILSLLYRLPPDRCKVIMIDPKMLELSVYDGIPHLLSPVVTDPKKAVVALKWTVREMEDRYKKMSKLGVRNIDGFNARVAAAAKSGETVTRTVQTGFDAETGEPIYETEEMALEPMPYLVVIIDEMADLMMVAGKDIEGAVQRLAQMARAAGIHIITATQRPSVDVITGTIKANFPTRISFQVTSKIDSRTILGEQGAEQLLGQGDMLFMEGGGKITRAHGPFVADSEVEEIVNHLKAQGMPAYVAEVTEESDDDPLISTAAEGDSDGDIYDQAVAVILRDKKVSTSYVQRRLSIGYNRAATLIERMEEEGVISAPNAKGQREILVGGEDG